MRRGLECLDQRSTGLVTLQAIELGCVHHHHRLTTMDGHALRPGLMRKPDHLAEPRFRVLEPPGRDGLFLDAQRRRRFRTGHADQIGMARPS